MLSENLLTESARVYIKYEGNNIPPHPGDAWTRFICISDTHSRKFPVPSGDVLLHAGDLSSWGYPTQLECTLLWLSDLDHPTKIIIAGNHDLCLDSKIPESVLGEDATALEFMRSYIKSQALRDAGIYYLEHEGMEITAPSGRKWSVYGSPAAPRYAHGSFQYSTEEEALDIYQQIPSEVEILLTHTPPHMVLDLTRRGKRAGCPYLAERLTALESCRLHVFGHIHECSGAQTFPSGSGNRVAVNAAMAMSMQVPIIVDLKN